MLQNRIPWEEPVLETEKLPLNIFPAELFPIVILLEPLLLKFAAAFQVSAVPLPNIKYPAPVLIKVLTPLKVLPPLPASLTPPFLVAFTVPLKVQPLKYISGLTTVTLPPKTELFPKNNCVVVPVNAKLIGAVPNCVNVPNLKYPALKPAVPTKTDLPEASVGVPVPLFQPKPIPPVFVELTMILSLNCS